MICKDLRGNEFIDIINIDEEEAMKRFSPITHCLAVVILDGDYLLGWNNWRKYWEIFGGCIEEGESMRQCIIRECYEELGISGVHIDYIGLMHLNLVPDYFSSQYREEYGGLYGICLEGGTKRLKIDTEEIGGVALLKNIPRNEKIAEIDYALLNYYPQ